MLLGFLLVILVLVCIAMSAVILLQRSEGGALGMGGGPSGFMTARGAGDLLTRTTSILAAIFFGLCLLMTVIAGRMHAGGSVVDRLNIHNMSPDDLAKAMRAGAPPPATPPAGAPAPGSPTSGAPASGAPAPGPNTAIFEAPAPQVHTAPAGTPAAQPTPTAPRTASHAATVFGLQTAPQAAPTVAPLAKPAPTKPPGELNIPAAPAPSMTLTPAPAGNSTGGA